LDALGKVLYNQFAARRGRYNPNIQTASHSCAVTINPRRDDFQLASTSPSTNQALHHHCHPCSAHANASGSEEISNPLLECTYTISTPTNRISTATTPALSTNSEPPTVKQEHHPFNRDPANLPPASSIHDDIADQQRYQEGKSQRAPDRRPSSSTVRSSTVLSTGTCRPEPHNLQATTCFRVHLSQGYSS
jgi:hypothetical protein